MSKVEVNTIEPQCGTTLTVGKCTTSVAVPGNVVKSNALQASDGGNIVSQSGTDITLGASGDTINLASGASQSGFGRTGTVDWVTTPKVTGDSPVTAATGSGYFLNTTSGTITINLPAGAAGSIVSMADYAGTWDTYAVTVTPNGAEKIGGFASSAVLNTERQSVTFVYIDGTQGWVNVQDSTSGVVGNPNLIASVSGACNTLVTAPDCADAKIATFVGPGTFTVCNAASCAANNVVSYMVVAGGGGSGPGDYSGGGGAGGFRELVSPTAPYTPSPLNGYPNAPNRITVTTTAYPIAIGGGGAGGSSCSKGVSGGASSFSTISSAGGGGGGDYGGGGSPGLAGGSGGGGASNCGPGGAGNTPPTSPAQGFTGGQGTGAAGGGGGGATTVGGTSGTTPAGTPGGVGATTEITASPVAYSTGGKGAGASNPAANGGDNTGDGGCRSNPGTAPSGGSGIVVIRYKFQN
jgi:hypothetical protein